MRLGYNAEAEAELLEAAQFYEDRAPGLAIRFLEAFERGLARVLEDPERWQLIEEGVRRFSLDTFPYAICYCIADERLIVIAVMHHSRRPEYWRYRLEQ